MADLPDQGGRIVVAGVPPGGSATGSPRRVEVRATDGLGSCCFFHRRPPTAGDRRVLRTRRTRAGSVDAPSDSGARPPHDDSAHGKPRRCRSGTSALCTPPGLRRSAGVRKTSTPVNVCQRCSAAKAQVKARWPASHQVGGTGIGEHPQVRRPRHHRDDLVAQLGTLTAQCARFLEGPVASGLNVLVSDGTQTGKPALR